MLCSKLRPRSFQKATGSSGTGDLWCPVGDWWGRHLFTQTVKEASSSAMKQGGPMVWRRFSLVRRATRLHMRKIWFRAEYTATLASWGVAVLCPVLHSDDNSQQEAHTGVVCTPSLLASSVDDAHWRHLVSWVVLLLVMSSFLGTDGWAAAIRAQRGGYIS